MPKLLRRQLIAYAVVSQNLEGSQDILSGLMPFFDPIIDDLADQVFDPEKLSNKVTELYEWPFNSDVAEELIPRLVAQGRIKELAEDGQRGVYVCCPVKDPEIEQLEVSAEKRLREIATLFHEFCEHLSPLLSRDHGIVELEEILLNWMVAVEGFDRSAIDAAVDKLLDGERPEISGDGDLEDNLVFVRPNLQGEESYLCACFVQNLSKTNEKYFNSLADIASVALLTEVVLDIRNPPDANRKEPDLVVILDAPLLMDAMGLSGVHSRDRVDDTIEVLKKLQAKFWVFDHSCREITRNLRTMFALEPHRRYGPTADAIRKGEVLEPFARDVMADVSGNITKLLEFQIIRQNLDEFPNSHNFFEFHLYEEFSARANWHEHAEPRSIDALSVSLIMRRRGATHTRDPLKSKFIMVSRNKLFAELARRFGQEHELIFENEVGPVIHQRPMAALMMLTLGYQGQREFTRRHILGSCERVLRMRPQVAKTAWETLRKVKPDLLPQLQALLTRPRSVQVLTNKTLNVDRAINIENVVDLVKLMENSLGEKHRNAAKIQIAKIKTESKNRERQLKSKIQDLDSKLDQRSTEIENQAKQLKEIFDSDKKTLCGWVEIAKTREKMALKVASIFFIGLAVLFALLQLNLDWFRDGVWGWVAAALSLVFALMSLRVGIPKVTELVITKWRDQFLQNRIKETHRQDLLEKFEIDWQTGTVTEKRMSAGTAKEDLFD